MLLGRVLCTVLRFLFADRAALIAENLALRHQMIVLRRSVKRPRICLSDRFFWVFMSRIWDGWASALLIVGPATVVRWHRQGFRLYWRLKSRPGRPRAAHDVRELIRKMSRANPLWGAPRIHGELLKLGIAVSQATVSKYMPRPRKPPSTTWRAFLENHIHDLVSVDFLTVPTATFRILFVFIVLSHDRRRVLHFNVTDSPSAEWTAQQLREAFPWETVPRFLIRDRDGVYGNEVTRTVANLGIEQVLTAPRSPWQNAYAERVIGSIRRECLDHVIVMNERHLHRILRKYFSYYHASRTHLSLEKDAPDRRPPEPPGMGEIIAVPQVGGLHHRYTRRAA